VKQNLHINNIINVNNKAKNKRRRKSRPKLGSADKNTEQPPVYFGGNYSLPLQNYNDGELKNSIYMLKNQVMNHNGLLEDYGHKQNQIMDNYKTGMRLLTDLKNTKHEENEPQEMLNLEDEIEEEEIPQEKKKRGRKKGISVNKEREKLKDEYEGLGGNDPVILNSTTKKTVQDGINKLKDESKTGLKEHKQPNLSVILTPAGGGDINRTVLNRSNSNFNFGDVYNPLNSSNFGTTPTKDT